MLYVNDLPNYITNAHVTMFADDTTISVSANCIEEIRTRANLAISDLSAWCDRNKLILNNKKTIIINFYIRRCLPQDFEISKIRVSHETKFLGTILDTALSWDAHIENICKKLHKAYFGILQMKDTLDVKGLLSIYYALAYSHISLNILSWGCGRDKNRVFILQKRIMRLIFNLSFNETCKDIYKEKGVLCIYI